MLVRFALDSSGLSLEGLPQPVRIQTLRRLLEFWYRIGLLVHEGESLSQSALHEAVEALPPVLRRSWKEAMNGCRHRRGPESWEGLHAVSALRELDVLTGGVQLAILESARAARLGLSEDCASTDLHPSVEIARVDSFDAASSITHAEQMTHTLIRHGEEVSVIWRDRMQELAAISRQVVVVDRYAGVNAVEQAASGARRFLVEVGRVANQSAVKLLVSTGKQVMTQQIERVISEIAPLAISADRLRSIELLIVPDALFGKISHGRHIRFDRLVQQIDIGLEILEGTRVRRGSSYHQQVSSPSGEHRKVEERLGNVATFRRTFAATDLTRPLVAL